MRRRFQDSLVMRLLLLLRMRRGFGISRKCWLLNIRVFGGMSANLFWDRRDGSATEAD